MKKPNIVICNDDGINAPGIHHLALAVKDMANIMVVAPAEDQSCKGMGMSLPESRVIEAEKVDWIEPDIQAWQVFGTPTDCVKFALHFLTDHKPDFVLSGINNGSNAGRNVIYSGTVAAAAQATFNNIPGIAFSCMYDEGPGKFAKAAKFIPRLFDHFQKHPIPKGILMNINFPSTSSDGILGLRMARQGKSYWDLRIGRDTRLKGTKKYPIIDGWDLHDEHAESDIHLLTEGYITCVPVHVHDLTEYEFLKSHAPLFEKLNRGFKPDPQDNSFSDQPSEK